MTINFAVYISPVIPFGAPPIDPSSPDAGLWSPTSCTLIYTANTALLVDCTLTIPATRALAEWIKTTLPAGCKLKYFVTTHAHGDHFFGFPVLQELFPDVRAYASANVIRGVDYQYTSDFFHHGWKVWFPTTSEGTGIPEARVHFTPLSKGASSPGSDPDAVTVGIEHDNEIDLDGHVVRVHDVPHGDTGSASFIHVPDLTLVVAGDIVYNGHCHQYMGEANTPTKRQAWIDALTLIASLDPAIIIPGHAFDISTLPDKSNARGMLADTEAFMLDFAEELKNATTKEELMRRLRVNYGSRWNLWILAQGVEASWANR